MGAVLLIQDITELRELEKVRKDFVANVTHELKTPLTSIKGFVETLKSGAIRDEETDTEIPVHHRYRDRAALPADQ